MINFMKPKSVYILREKLVEIEIFVLKLVNHFHFPYGLKLEIFRSLGIMTRLFFRIEEYFN